MRNASVVVVKSSSRTGERRAKMLKRKPTRLEFKESDDKEELEQARRRAAATAAGAAAGSSAGSTGGPLATAQVNECRPKLTVAQRIGFTK
ncbi:hypothetical protein R1flu_000370 [Riccia fluitans]|uniref:Uncharacterized protein n=1 Tax=Riccia fluitans TaxID=41844 RepID=A0ABD1Y0Q5_9MARC